LKALGYLAVLATVSGQVIAAGLPADFPSPQALEHKQQELLPIIRRDLWQPAAPGNPLMRPISGQLFPK